MDTPTVETVWNQYESDEEVVCPQCSETAFRFVPLGVQTTIDTIGSVRICATEQGTYFHTT